VGDAAAGGRLEGVATESVVSGVESLKRKRAGQEGRRGPSEAAPQQARAGLRSPLAVAVGTVGLLLPGVGILVTRSTSDVRPATDRMAGGAAPPAGVAVSVVVDALSKEVQPETAPTAQLLAFAHQALGEGKIPAAMWAYQRALSREPKNSEALIHLGLMLHQGGHMDQPLARVGEGLSADPKYAYAHRDQGHRLFEGKKDYAAAARALEGFLALVPTGEGAERARQATDEAHGRRG
jgi:cytochrome c-type biogenesis protein CcmH/NrfG